MNKFFFLMLIFCFSQLNAQTVTGKIANQLGEPVSDASVTMYINPAVYYAVTSSEGTFIFNNVNDVEEESELPEGYLISNNFPNPFNPKTRILMNLPKESKVKISVFNILGESVLNEAEKVYSQGNHNIDLELNGFANGIYITRIIIDDKYSITRKLVLLYGTQHLMGGGSATTSAMNKTNSTSSILSAKIDSLAVTGEGIGTWVFKNLPVITSDNFDLGVLTAVLANIDNILTTQDNADNLLSFLLTVKDTAAALDSVVVVLLKDTSVFAANVSSQGISIKYKSGIIGGILLNPEDGEPLSPDMKNRTVTPIIPADINSFTPTSKKTILINPNYYERKIYVNPTINLYNTIFPRIGYNPPVTLLDSAATIDAMTSLAGYGIVHISSHGYAYPSTKNITEVYLMTGEKVNLATSVKYQLYLDLGLIGIIKANNNENRYWLSSAFFADHNNFSKDSTIIFGGFCYSFLGDWPNAMINTSRAGAYTGYSWEIRSDWNQDLARSLFDTLSNNSLKTPRTLGYWLIQTPSVIKEFWYPKDTMWSQIWAAGRADLTLWVPCPPTFTEDGKTYNTVEIGSQCWLKENLDIGFMIDSTQEMSDNGIIEKYCYNNNPGNCSTYGGLYQWKEAMQYIEMEYSQGICPRGWYIPTKDDFLTLIATVNENANSLKATSQGVGGGVGTNTSGFGAMLGGYRYYEGYFINLEYITHFWTSTDIWPVGLDGAYYMYLASDHNVILILYNNQFNGYSVRCIKY